MRGTLKQLKIHHNNDTVGYAMADRRESNIGPHLCFTVKASSLGDEESIANVEGPTTDDINM